MAAHIGLVAGCLLTSFWVQAVTVSGLYEASVEVNDRSLAERKRAQEAGFAQVLVKVTGDSTIVDQENVRTELANADKFTEQFGFQSRSRPSSDPDAALQTAIFLNITFDQAAVNRYLRDNGYPIWASNRPNIVLWLAYDSGFSREIMGGNTLAQLQELLMEVAQRRGLALQVPNMSKQDARLVQAGDIWGMFMTPIIKASKAYQSDVVVAVKIQQEGERVNLRATLLMGGDEQQLSISGQTLENALVEFVNQVADKVGASYAVMVSADAAAPLVLKVSGVNSLDDYAGLNRYLRGLITVRDTQVRSVVGDEVEVRVMLEGKTADFTQSLKLDRVLLEVEVLETEIPAPEAPVSELPVAMPSPLTLPVEPEPQIIRVRWSRK